MTNSFIELPHISEVQELSRVIGKKVSRVDREPRPAASSVFAAQCINNFLGYFTGIFILSLGLLALPQLSLSQIAHAKASFWVGILLLVWMQYMVWRVLFLLSGGESLGEQILGLKSSPLLRHKILGALWESLAFICPALWILEALCRTQSLKIGVEYRNSYSSSKKTS